MSYPVHGKDVVIELQAEDLNWDPILCGEDCTFRTTPEFVLTTGPTSGLFRERIKRREEWSMSVTGLTKIENNSSLTFFYMLSDSVRRTRHTVRITFTDEDGDSKQISGNVYIGQMDISGPASDYSRGSIELLGTGPFTVSEVEPPTPAVSEVFADYWTTTAGQAWIDGSSTGETDGTSYTLQVTDEILAVTVENQKLYATTGTPTNAHYKFNTTTAVLLTSVMFDGSEKVYVLWRRTV